MLAQEADALRRELEQMRRNFESMQQQYQKSMDALSERLRKLESQPQPVASPTAAQTPPPGTGMSPSTPSALDIIRPRQPFTLAPQRGTGQLLFDMGVAGDFVANVTQRNVDKANAGHVPESRERSFPGARSEIGCSVRSPRTAGRGPDRCGRETAVQDTSVALADGTSP